MQKKISRTIIILWLCLLLLPIEYIAAAESLEGCGDPFDNAVGPFDYTDNRQRTEELPIVENYHFTADVESLNKGATSEFIMHDLDYTLRASPNHHRALYAVLKYQLKKNWIKGRYRTAECYFVRANKFQPKDGVPYMLHAIFLHKKKKLKSALEQYILAQGLLPDSAEIPYNIGLLYIDMKEYKSALKYAKRAYKLGYPLPGLREKLRKLGSWSEGEK